MVSASPGITWRARCSLHKAIARRAHTRRKWKDSKLREDPTWTLEKEMASRRGVELPVVRAVVYKHV